MTYIKKDPRVCWVSVTAWQRYFREIEPGSNWWKGWFAIADQRPQ